ncbi:hypothetical protein [Vaginisenegalia massiliensis]|uniref:hypothetical protein n=1 Tax=Vaginisenegalia massiliensis TaxID=2058294 RepID=UPI0013DDD722|nr:hypothetical protein [Vaginisenegalia massiliensis]
MTHYDDFMRLTCTTQIKELKEDYYLFDDTVFYAEKGGQLSDQGTINGLPVTDLKWEDDQVWHQVAGTLENPIQMEVDCDTRYLNTAIQTAYHLLDGYYERLGLCLTSVSVTPGNQWYEVNSKDIDQDHLDQVQTYMNEAIRQEIPIEYSYMKGQDYPDPAYQKYDQLRLVKIGQLNQQPCGTPHVYHTGQIGSFIILGSQKASKGTRIQVSCNLDSQYRFQAEHDLIRHLSQAFNLAPDQLLDGLIEMGKQVKSQKKQLDDLNRQLAEVQAQALVNEQAKILQVEVKEATQFRYLSQALSKLSSQTQVLLATIEGQTNFAIISPDKKARDIFAKWQESLPLTGGGSPIIVSGKVALPLDQSYQALVKMDEMA